MSCHRLPSGIATSTPSRRSNLETQLLINELIYQNERSPQRIQTTRDDDGHIGAAQAFAKQWLANFSLKRKSSKPTRLPPLVKQKTHAPSTQAPEAVRRELIRRHSTVPVVIEVGHDENTTTTSLSNASVSSPPETLQVPRIEPVHSVGPAHPPKRRHRATSVLLSGPRHGLAGEIVGQAIDEAIRDVELLR